MENTYFKEIALKNYNFATVPDIINVLSNHIKQILMDKFKITVIQSGSFQSHTTVAGYSDIDMLAVIDYKSTSEINPKAYIISVCDVLMESFRVLDVDVDYDMPAVCITHLSQPDYPIEITPAIRTIDFNIDVGEESCDYYILNDNFTDWVDTNPLLQRTVAEYLNIQTKQGFSYICSLLKLWKKTHNIEMLSFGIEVFLYHWLRGSLKDSTEFDKEHYNGVINLSFICRGLCNTLEENILFVMKDLYSYLDNADKNDKIFNMKNPVVRRNSDAEQVYLFKNRKEQSRCMDKLKKAIPLLEVIIEGATNYSYHNAYLFLGLERGEW